MTVYRVTAEHTPRGWWVLEQAELGAVSQVRRLDRAADEMREAIAYLAGVDESEVDVRIEPVLPEGFETARTRSVQLWAEADRLRSEAAAASREGARALSGAGFSVRDIGALMGVSPQRVSQLVNS